MATAESAACKPGNGLNQIVSAIWSATAIFAAPSAVANNSSNAATAARAMERDSCGSSGRKSYSIAKAARVWGLLRAVPTWLSDSSLDSWVGYQGGSYSPFLSLGIEEGGGRVEHCGIVGIQETWTHVKYDTEMFCVTKAAVSNSNFFVEDLPFFFNVKK